MKVGWWDHPAVRVLPLLVVLICGVCCRRAWVASPALQASSAPSSSVHVAFFVRAYSTDEDEDGLWQQIGTAASGEGEEAASTGFARWKASLMALLVQHPPRDFVFRSRTAMFVEVRVTDKEMQLSLEQAVDLMYARATVYQQRPYVIVVAVDDVVVGEHRRAKTVMLPSNLAEGPHNLTVTLKDIHLTPLEIIRQTFTIQTTLALDGGAQSTGAGAAGVDIAGQCEGLPKGEAEWWACPEDDYSSCAAGLEQVCSGHGRCRGSACVCDGDWYGQECSHHMLTETSFLPSLDPALTWLQGSGGGKKGMTAGDSEGLATREAGGLRCSATREFQYGATSLAREVWRRQFPSRCLPSPVASFRLRVPLQGIGIMLQFLVVGLVEALESNRTMLLHPLDWPWLAHPDCGRAAHDCYFFPISSCSYLESLPPQGDVADAAQGDPGESEESRGVVEIAAKAVARAHIRRAGLERDSKGRPNTNVGLLVPSVAFLKPGESMGHAGDRWQGRAVRVNPGVHREGRENVGGQDTQTGHDRQNDQGGEAGTETVTPVVGWFWMRSHLLSAALQLLPHRSMDIRFLKAQLGFPSRNAPSFADTLGRGKAGEGKVDGSAKAHDEHVSTSMVGGVVGVHIRRGDACAASVGYRTPCQPLQVYVEAVLQMVQRYQATDVFVASDDSEALRELKALEGLNVMFLPQDRSMLDSHWYVEDRIRHGLLDAALAVRIPWPPPHPLTTASSPHGSL